MNPGAFTAGYQAAGADVFRRLSARTGKPDPMADFRVKALINAAKARAGQVRAAAPPDKPKR